MPANSTPRKLFHPTLWLGLCLLCLCLETVLASPLYSRQYKVSCSACHHAPPKLNVFGERFKLTNSLPNWESNTSVDTGDLNTAVPKTFPISLHTQLLATAQRGHHIEDYTSGESSHNNNIDFKTPRFVKLISSAPLTEEIAYYFDARLKPGENNGAFTIGETWLRYRLEGKILGTLTAGQFPASDVIVDQDTRLTVKNLLIYRQSGIDADRGLRGDIDFGFFYLSLGLSNGNNADNDASMNSVGVGRDDVLFDENNRKSLYFYLSSRYRNHKLGLFWQTNQQAAAADSLGTGQAERQSYRYTTGVDIQAFPSAKVSWSLQFMWNQWQDFLAKGERINWYGGYLSVDYAATSHTAYSLLYNFTSAGDFAGSGTIYEGLATNVVTTTLSYYFRSNVRGILEISMDFLPKDNDPDFVGHESKEDMISLGLDLNY